MPPSLGQRLKHAREKRGLDLRDVQHRTRIPVARLQDLEDDRLNTFGGMAYAKSFLRTYATLLDINADEVLVQMKPPPLGGVRDYRYLVETQGPWLAERDERHAALASAPALPPGKSFLFAAMVCLAFGLLIGGAVLANAYFNSKNAAASAAAQNKADATAPPTATAVTESYSSPTTLAEDQGFTVQRAELPEPSTAAQSANAPPPPKAVPVIEPPPRSGRKPPKAERVR